jgi:two-component system chemotaxis response regulator CheB
VLSGPLYEIQDGKLVRFRCRVGHAYTADSMLDEKSEALENALYVALNTLAESAAMSERLTTRSHNPEHAARRFEERAQDARRQPAIRRVLTEHVAVDAS